MKIDYNVTDEQLRAFGIAQRIIDLSRQPYMRPGQVDFDGPYAANIDEARDRIALAALAINNPDEKIVWYPPHFPMNEALFGLIRHDEDGDIHSGSSK